MALTRAINWLMIIIALQLEPFAQRLNRLNIQLQIGCRLWGLVELPDFLGTTEEPAPFSRRPEVPSKVIVYSPKNLLPRKNLGRPATET